MSFRMNGNTNDHIVADIRYIATMVGSKQKWNSFPIRRLCKYYYTKIPEENAQPKKVSVFYKKSPSAPTKACIGCLVPLYIISSSNTGIHAGKSCFKDSIPFDDSQNTHLKRVYFYMPSVYIYLPILKKVS